MTANNEVFIRNPQILSTEIEDEAVLLSVEKQSYFGLPATSRRIWELLAQPRSLQSICDELLREYNVDPNVCAQDVRSFMNELIRERLVQRV